MSNQEIILRKGLYCLVAKLEDGQIKEVEVRSETATSKPAVIRSYARMPDGSYGIENITKYSQGRDKRPLEKRIALVPAEEVPEKVRMLVEADAKSLQKLLEGGYSIELHGS